MKVEKKSETKIIVHDLNSSLSKLKKHAYTFLKLRKMKKVNKQCLLDTPRTERFSEKLGKLSFKPAILSFEKISVESVQQKL